jgi:hypothetical protein
MPGDERPVVHAVTVPARKLHTQLLKERVLAVTVLPIFTG